MTKWLLLAAFLLITLFVIFKIWFAKCPDDFFIQHGDLPGCEDISTANDISADGVRVVGYSSADEAADPNDCRDTSAHKQEATGWTRRCATTPPFWPGKPKGLIPLGYFPSPSEGSLAYGISPDGEVAVGFSDVSANHNDPVVFLPSGVQKLALPHAIGTALDVSSAGVNEAPTRGDWGSFKKEMHGRVIVGFTSESGNYAWYLPAGHAVYWNTWTNIVVLRIPVLPNGQAVISSEAVCISDNAMTIGGELYYDQRGEADNYQSCPCVWTFRGSEYVPEVLKDLDGGDDNARVTHISGDGRVVVGWGATKMGDPTCYAYPRTACKWTRTAAGWSDPQPLTPLPGFKWAKATGTNGNGSVVVGSSYAYDDSCPSPNFNSRATIWHGAAATDITASLAPKVPKNVRLWEATRVSNNGRIVTGYSNDYDWKQEGWTAGN